MCIAHYYLQAYLVVYRVYELTFVSPLKSVVGWGTQKEIQNISVLLYPYPYRGMPPYTKKPQPFSTALYINIYTIPVSGFHSPNWSEFLKA